jgi:hypothetical protein
VAGVSGQSSSCFTLSITRCKIGARPSFQHTYSSLLWRSVTDLCIRSIASSLIMAPGGYTSNEKARSASLTMLQRVASTSLWQSIKSPALLRGLLLLPMPTSTPSLHQSVHGARWPTLRTGWLMVGLCPIGKLVSLTTSVLMQLFMCGITDDVA